MKIAVFHNLPSGGAKRALYEFLKELKKRGHSIDAFLPQTANEQFLPLDDVVNNKHVYPVKTFFHRINLKGFRTLYFLEQSLLAQARCQRLIADEINSGNYDLVLANHSVPTQSPFLLRYLKIPSVYYLQEPIRWAYEHPIKDINTTMKRSTVKMLYERALVNYILKPIDESNTSHATILLVNSYYSHESIMKAYGLNAYVSYLGVNTEIFKYDRNVPKENIILSVGRLIQQKGFRFIIKAMAKISNKIKKPKLIILGDADSSSERSILISLARENHIDVEIKIGITDTELVQYYNKALLVVYAPYLEPFGLVTLESMACGTPVVGVKESGIREVIEDNVTGLLVERDVNKFAEAIEYLLNKNDVRDRMGKKSIESVKEKWTWQKATDNLIEHLQTIIKQHG
ncbi:MAG: glycosyltransferase family 4 protein [Deltaproteobacteria bacterium]|nr:glycosyltransferase family 4 protein [Deltaproteobacteria bacterium]